MSFFLETSGGDLNSVGLAYLKPVKFIAETQKPEKKRIGKKIFLAILLLVFLFSFFLFLGYYSYKLFTDIKDIKILYDSSKESLREKNWEQFKQNLESFDIKIGSLETNFRKIHFVAKFVPFVNYYTYDFERAIKIAKEGRELANIFVELVEPYKDILGFAPDEESKDYQTTTQERIDFIIKSLPQVVSRLDEIETRIKYIQSEESNINPERYPEKFFGFPIREKIKFFKEDVNLVSDLFSKGKPLLLNANWLLGIDETRTYLVLFQNDKELRPTGGFITAYSIAKVRGARFEPVVSDDIYNLDSKYIPRIPAPDVYVKYLKGPYLLSKNMRLRDINWSADFSHSMKLFLEEVSRLGIKNVDGVIAVDTHVLVKILDVLEKVYVPGFGEFSNKKVPECDCPQVIFELESFADVEGPIVWSQDEPGKIIYAPPNYENRKKIIGPLMNSILAATLGQPKENFPKLFEVFLDSLLGKHVLLYINNEKVQQAIDEFGIGGSLKETKGDYLYVVDANLGGRKSNLYVTQEISQKIGKLEDGTWEKEVVITYKNPEPYDGWLNSVLPNWVRIYVPKGSQLISISGLEDKVEPYEEFGKTVFAGFFRLRPQGIAVVELKYKLPINFNEYYNLLFQKQPGKDKILSTLKIGKETQEFYLTYDKEIRVKI